MKACIYPVEHSASRSWKVLASLPLLISSITQADPLARNDSSNLELSSVDIVGISETLDNDPVDPEPAAYSRFAMPRSVMAQQTLTREDIEAIRPRDVSDLIEGALGMSIGRQGARVHNFSYNRGDEVTIILDGVYLTQTESQRVLGDIPVEMIDSIRFIRDSSVITVAPLMKFGSSSAGSPNQGFILIQTRKGSRGRNETELRASYARYDTRKWSGFASRSWLDDRLYASLGYQDTESNGRPHWNNAYQGDTWLFNTGWNGNGFEASASLYVNDASREIQRAIGTYKGTTSYPVSGPTPSGVLDKNIWKYDPMDTRVLSLNLARHWSETQTTALTYGWTESHGKRYRYSTLTDKSTVSGDYAEDRAEEWNLSHTYDSEQLMLKLGAQTTSWNQLTEGSDSARKEKIYGIYTTGEYRVTPAWSVDAAFRMDKKHIRKGGDAYLSDGTRTKLANDIWTDKAVLWSIGTSWQVDPVWRLSARYSYNRTPTPDTLTTRDNASLPSEKRDRYELGIQANFARAMQVSLTPFYYVLKDTKVSDGTITTDANGNAIINPYTGEETSVTIYKAIDQAVRKGFELNVTGDLGEAWHYELGWSHFSANDENGTSGNEVPDNKYNGRLGWKQGPWSANLSVTRVDPYLSYDYTVGDFTNVSVSLSRTLWKDMTLTLFGQNILDEHYGTNNKGYPAQANWGVLRDVGATYGVEFGIHL